MAGHVRGGGESVCNGFHLAQGFRRARIHSDSTQTWVPICWGDYAAAASIGGGSTRTGGAAGGDVCGGRRGCAAQERRRISGTNITTSDISGCLGGHSTWRDSLSLRNLVENGTDDSRNEAGGDKVSGSTAVRDSRSQSGR